jgi:hypothetical protein
MVPKRWTSLRKLILITMLVGFLVAVSIALTGFYSHPDVGHNTMGRNLLIAVVVLWPTVALVPLDASYNTAGFIALGISAVANGMLYGLVAFGAALVWKYVFSPKGKRERAQSWWPSSDQEH